MLNTNFYVAFHNRKINKGITIGTNHTHLGSLNKKTLTII